MNVKLLKIGIIVLCIVIIGITYALSRMFPTKFKFQDFIPYQCWLAGIAIFCLILPAKVGTIFLK
tara:strand:- start:2115 stop:2309 length:195 start_codon:yes stop_codon:yes gene_type:complete